MSGAQVVVFDLITIGLEMIHFQYGVSGKFRSCWKPSFRLHGSSFSHEIQLQRAIGMDQHLRVTFDSPVELVVCHFRIVDADLVTDHK